MCAGRSNVGLDSFVPFRNEKQIWLRLSALEQVALPNDDTAMG